MIYSIEEIKQIAIPIVSEYGIARLGIFGSYARGEANEDSDLDFIMDTVGLIGMIQYNAIIRKLEEEFGCHVDIITTGCSDREFLTRIQKEEILIYIVCSLIDWIRELLFRKLKVKSRLANLEENIYLKFDNYLS